METTLEQFEQLERARAIDQQRLDTEESQKRSETEAQEKESHRMGTMFFFILLILCVIGDLIDIFTAGTVGWLIGLFIDGIVLLATGLSKAGRKQFKRIVIGLIGDSIPILAILPFRSVFLTWGFIKSRSTALQSVSPV